MRISHEQVLQFLEQGHTTKEAAEFFGLPRRTIGKKRDRGLEDRAKAIAKAELAVKEAIAAALAPPEPAVSREVLLTPPEPPAPYREPRGEDGRWLWELRDDDGMLLLDSHEGSVVPHTYRPHEPQPIVFDPAAEELRGRIYEEYRPRTRKEKAAALVEKLLP